MQLVETRQAIGHLLCHDVTRIVPGVTKGVAFPKGHVVREEDIPLLLSIGKEYLYIWQADDSKYHENEAAEILRDICINDHMDATRPREGKIDLVASLDGLLKVDTAKIDALILWAR